MYLIRTQADGDTLWTRCIGGKGSEEGLYVRQTSDNGFIVCGRTESMGAGEDDIYLIKTDADGHIVSTSLDERPSEGFSIYPNPSDGLITLQISSEVILIEISDCKGVVVYSNPSRDTTVHPLKLNLSYLSKGIYFIRIGTAHGSAYRKLILLQ